MEALRLEGNASFGADPARAAELYEEAMRHYERSLAEGDGATTDPTCTLEEYTKCAGNALTCLFKLGRHRECVALAQRALRLNPIFAKANAFIGRSACEEAALLPTPAATPLLFLCRAVYLLPAMEEAARACIAQELDRLLTEQQQARRSTSGGGEADTAAALVVVRAGSCGNGVFAAKDVPAFSLVSDMCQPFAVASYEETGGVGLCAHCGHSLASVAAGAAALPHCKGCGLTYYCSAGCEAAHRTVQHEPFECAKLRKLKEMTAMCSARGIDVPEEFFELAQHTITTLSAYQAHRPGWEELTLLESHAREVAVNLAPTAPLLHDLYADTPALSKDFISEVLGIVRCNSLELEEEHSGMGVGQALYCGAHTCTSYFNHSCAPNCAIDSARHGIVTTRAVAAGEELCISYMPQLYWPCRLRQHRLSEHFYFTCRCQRCAKSDEDPTERAMQMELPGAKPVDGVTAKYHVKVQTKCSEIRSLPVEEIQEAHVKAVRDLQTELGRHVFPFHYLQHELRNLLSFLYAVLGDAPQCLECCLDELLMWESIVPGALPVKQMKVRNALQCVDGAEDARVATTCRAALYPHLVKFALVYDVAELDVPPSRDTL